MCGHHQALRDHRATRSERPAPFLARADTTAVKTQQGGAGATDLIAPDRLQLDLHIFVCASPEGSVLSRLHLEAFAADAQVRQLGPNIPSAFPDSCSGET